MSVLCIHTGSTGNLLANVIYSYSKEIFISLSKKIFNYGMKLSLERNTVLYTGNHDGVEILQIYS